MCTLIHTYTPTRIHIYTHSKTQGTEEIEGREEEHLERVTGRASSWFELYELSKISTSMEGVWGSRTLDWGAKLQANVRKVRGVFRKQIGTCSPGNKTLVGSWEQEGWLNSACLLHWILGRGLGVNPEIHVRFGEWHNCICVYIPHGQQWREGVGRCRYMGITLDSVWWSSSLHPVVAMRSRDTCKYSKHCTIGQPLACGALKCIYWVLRYI